MASPVKLYQQEMHKNMGFFATWLPSSERTGELQVETNVSAALGDGGQCMSRSVPPSAGRYAMHGSGLSTGS